MRKKRGEYSKWKDMCVHIPEVAGIYSIWCDSTLLYIGCAANIHSRLCTHGKRDLFLKHKPILNNLNPQWLRRLNKPHGNWRAGKFVETVQ